MKKKYSIDRIEPGSRFTADAFSDGDNMFVPAGIPIRAKDLEGLKRWGITAVFSEGNLEEAGASSSGAGTQDSAGHAQKSGLAAFSDHKLYGAYTDMIDRLKSLMDKIAAEERVEPKMIDKLSGDLVQLVREKEAAIVSAILSANVVGYDMARAGVNCAILSVVVGQTMKLPPHRLVHLASGALLHDVGMLRVPDAIVGKKGSLSPEEAQKMRAHPLMSYRIITRELQYPDDVGLVGLQHHERWDGEGYPRKTAGQDTDLLSRIVSVADAFEAMVSQKPYRNSMIGYAAIKNLLSDNSRRFDPDVLKAFVRSMGIYPIGSIVVLNNAAIARVVDTHADAPLRPKIKVIVDEFGKHFKDDSGDTLDLLTEKSLFIARALDPRELEATAEPVGVPLPERVEARKRTAKGRHAESVVALSMASEGWSVLERNWRRGRGEIDIVAFRAGTLAFVEVKAIDAYGTESLAVSVGPGKRARIVETSKLFLAMHREFSSATVRYDVASVRSGAMADYYENAFAERT